MNQKYKIYMNDGTDFTSIIKTKNGEDLYDSLSSGNWIFAEYEGVVRLFNPAFIRIIRPLTSREC